MRHRYINPVNKGPRVTSRGIVIHDGSMLLMERRRDGMHYFSIPGGGVDGDEKPEDVVVRELYEEASVKVNPKQLLYDVTDLVDGHRHFIYLCEYISGTPVLHPESEEANSGPNQLFQPGWVPIASLESLSFLYWEPIMELLLKDLESGFSKQVKITSF
ncbi:MAG: NUDIX domain-containing protein [bacterium]|nr:NUDIX domain-containing protein [bacterium]